jgi:four helix bundle protein
MIPKGVKDSGDRVKLRSLYIAYGSTCELETQILLLEDLGYLNKEARSELKRDIGEIEKIRKALIKLFENKRSNP